MSFSDGLSDSVASSVFSTGTSTGYLGTSSGLFSFSGTSTSRLIPTGNAINVGSINGIFVSGTTVYTATSSGLSIGTVSGSTWSGTDHSVASIGMSAILCVFVDSGGTIYLGTATGMAYSTNSGSTWNLVSFPTSVNSIAVATAANETCIFAATPLGLYIYASGNSTVSQGWQRVFSGYPVNKVYVTP